MSEDQLMKLFKHMNKRFDDVEKRFEKVDLDNNKTLNAVDSYAKKAETFMQEELALGHKVDRLEQWIIKVAESTGVKLTA
jgi:hypothetical protein